MTVLTGKRIVITRAIHQASELEKLIREQNAIPILYPCIAIVPPDTTTELDAHLTTLESFDWLILTSTNTIYALADRLTALNHVPDWTQLKVAVVGSKTAKAFHEQFQHTPDFMPDVFTAEALAQSFPSIEQAKIFVPQSALADDTITQILSEHGANVISVAAYQTVIGNSGEDVPAMLQNNEIDVLTFTSSSTVENFTQRIHPQTLPDLPVVCIGSSTADTATAIGFTTIIVAKPHTLQGMMNALIAYYAQK